MKNTSPGLVTDMLYGTFELALAAHKSVEMLMDHDAFELRQGGTRDSVECFACRVGDQMDVKSLCSQNRVLSMHRSRILA